MKKVNYKSFGYVIRRHDEIFKDGRVFLYLPFSTGKFENSENVFDSAFHHVNSEEVLNSYFDEKNIKKYDKKKYGAFDNYSYVYKRIKTRLSQTKPNKPEIRKQIISFMKLLATNPDEAYFVGNLLASIYEAANFESKENQGKFATDEEKKKLLDLPLEILKANRHIKTFKRGVLYEMLDPYMYQEVLFNEQDILLTLVNDENFQSYKKNKVELKEYYREHFKNLRNRER